MEFGVRVVGGIESCYVSLPLLLIQTLQSTPSGFLPQVVTLELRSHDDHVWFVAWSGSASTSSAIEVAQQFAECINLHDHTSVQVRAVPNLPKATLVTIEPHTEDDWEVLELNADHAEDAILKQVRIVSEAMRFPLWLHGHTVVTFLVVSTIPKKAVVQLVPGTEVAVAPKRRRKAASHEDSYMQSSDKEHPIPRTLRVQDPDMRFIHKCEVKGIELGVVLTSVAFVHPETAKNYSLESLQIVAIEPRLPLKESIRNHEDVMLRKKSGTDKRESRQATVRLLISESVAKGHVMIARSLRLYLRARLHSWIYMKRCSITLKKDVHSLSLSPCQFKTLGKNKATEKNGAVAIDRQDSHKTSKMLLRTNSDMYTDMVDTSVHEEVVTALSQKIPSDENEEASSRSDPKKGVQCLLHAWFFAQLDAISSKAGEDVNSLLLGNDTLLHFQVRDHSFGTLGRVWESSNVMLDNREKTGDLSIEFFYVLSFPDESSHGGKIITYEVSFDDANKRNNDLGGLEMLFGKLSLGDPVSFYSTSEKTSNRGFSSSISSLSWMETAASDVINSRADGVAISCFREVV